MASLAEEHWRTLVERIQDGNCTPFIGAGACAGVLPLGRGLAAQLAAMLKRRVPEGTDLARIAQYLAVERRDNGVPKSAVAKLVAAATPPVFVEDEPHAALATLGAPIYLTTNYDDFMYRALLAERRQPIREACRWTKSLLEDEPSVFDDGFEPTSQRPIVFHLHGGVALHNNRSIVITEDDYLDYVVNISKDLSQNARVVGHRAMLPTRIRAAIRTSTLLFIGYSLADINFRVLLRGLVGSLEPSHRVLNVAVQLAPTDDNTPGDLDELRAYVENYFDWTLNIQIYWADAREFGRQLRDRLLAIPPQ